MASGCSQNGDHIYIYIYIYIVVLEKKNKCISIVVVIVVGGTISDTMGPLGAGQRGTRPIYHMAFMYTVITY
jgi:hypothetical protein